MTEFRRNTRNIGSYLIGNTLGEGAFGKVKLGTHIHTGEKVAIKILDKKKMQEDPDDIARVQSEIAILKKMRHKNIIQLYEIMESTRNIYLIMEYCEEKELFEHINTKKRLTEPEALKFFQEIIDTLDYLHCQNIVHRDLKPENLLLDYKLSIKLSDFGLSRTYTNDKLLSTPCGTPSYAPPEMLNGEEYHGLLSDIWSVGVVLYAMLSGYLPFDESNEEINCQNIVKGEYVLPNWISECAADLIKNILVTDPYYRYDLEQIKSHPWFNRTAPCLRPGIILGYHRIPIDEYILDQVEAFGYNKLKTRDNVLNNRFCIMTAIYYLLLRKYIKNGRVSISDLESDEYLRYIEDESNVIEVSHEENYRNLQDMLQECDPDQENDDNVCVYSQSITPSKRVSDSIKYFDKNEEDSSRKPSQRYSSNMIDNVTRKLSLNSSKEKVIELNTERQSSLNKTDFDNLSFKNFDSIFPSTRQRSITISQQENYAKRFVNRKSLFVHEDLSKFFDTGRERRMSHISGVKSALMDSMPRISVVLNQFRRNTCRNDNLKLDDEKLLAFLKLNSFAPNNSPRDNIENLEEFQSNNKITLNFTTNANQSNEKINNFNSSSHENSLDSMSSDSNFEESVETVHSRKRSIVNNNIFLDGFLNKKKSPTNVNQLNRTKNQPKTESKKINLTNRTNNNSNSLITNRLKKIQFSSRSKFIFKSNSKDKYNIEKLRPKVIFKRDKNPKESNSMPIKAQTIKKTNNVSIMKNIKPKVDKQLSLQDEREKFIHRNKFIKDSTLIKNDTSFEKSLSKTPNRNLSYSSHYAKKSRKNRVEEMPWNLKKKIIEVENFAHDTNNNQLDSIKGIIDRYEKFKQKHCNFKKAKNQDKKLKASSRKIMTNLNENDITIQDVQSSPLDRIENENEKDSLFKIKKVKATKETTPNKIKKFVCFEENSSLKAQWKNSSTVKYAHYNTISSTKCNYNNKSQTEKKGNKTTPFKENFISQETVFFSSNHIKEMFFKNAKMNFETNSKNTTKGINNFHLDKSNTFNYNPNKTNPSSSNKIFTTEDNHMNNLKFATGPIDIDAIYISEDVNTLIERMIEILNKKKITHIQTNPYKFKCSKNGISFEVQLFKLDGEEDYFTFKFRMFQGGSVNYRKLCQSIITEIY